MSALEFQILKNILEIIIPKDDINSMPSAADVNIIEFIKRNDKKLMTKLISFVREINLICQKQFNQNFSNIGIQKKIDILEEYKIKFQNDYNQIIRLILYCYYSDKDVLGKLNLKNDPPFPDGNKIRKGDLTLLKQVLDKKISFRS